MNAIPIMVFVPAIFSVLPGRAAASLKKNHEIFSVTPVTSIHVSCCIMLTAVIGIVSILAFYLMGKIKPFAKGMVHNFTIRFTIRTVAGFEPLCDFYLGNNRAVALSIFSQLEGNDEVRESDVLQVDLVETKDGLPFDVKIKHCTLSQLGRSCSFITKELFKYRNLVQGG